MTTERVDAWQQRLVPLMVGMVVFAAIFFSAISIREFERVHATLSPPKSEMALLLKSYDSLSPETFAQRLSIAEKKAELVTGQDAIARRYQQAHAIILARLWTRFMAFITGTLMALIGSAFILGKLREESTSLSGEGAGYKMSLASSSPGIVLATLGTVLMLAGLFSYFEIATTDAQAYRSADVSIPDDMLDGAPPPPIANTAASNSSDGQPR